MGIYNIEQDTSVLGLFCNKARFVQRSQHDVPERFGSRHPSRRILAEA